MFKHKTLARAFVSTLALAVLALVIPVGAALAAAGITATGTTGVGSGPAGSTVTVNGSGYTSGSITITFSANSVTYQTYTNAATVSGGAFTAYVTVPTSVPAGTYTVTATDSTNVAYSTTFQIIPAIVLSSPIANVGQQIYVTGYGFRGTSAINIYYDGAIVTSTTSAVNGSFGPLYFTVPASTTTTSTIHSVLATDGVNSASASLTVQQSVTVTPNTGSVGSSVTISGTGFGPSRSVTISFGGVILPTVVTDAYGNFSTTYAVPALTTHSVTVSANDGILSASTTFSLVAGVTLTPTSGTAGTSVTATGSGFSASRTVTLTMDGTQIGTGSTDAYGNFTTTLSIPSGAGGSHTITAYDGVYSASATFTVKSQLTLSPANGVIGSQVTATGNGYGANAAVIVNFDNTQVATVTAGATGAFSASFAVPSVAGGVHNVTASDGSNTATAQFTASAQILLNPKSGPTGGQVTISGNGFVTNAGITINFNNTQVKTAVAGANGALSAQFAVPDLDAGTYTVTASDSVNTASATFAVTSSMNLSPATGYVGSQVSVSGTGFSGTVTVKYDNATVGTTSADSNGTFTVSFSAPVSLHGDHTVLATDGTVTLQRTFTISSTPPPVPQLLLPASGSTQSSRPTLSWTSVTDPNGVTYDLQISSDPSFSNLLVNETGLTTTQYQLTSSESLKGTSSSSPYYWRVKAVDQASNESAFTTPNTFGVSTFPAWAMWLLIGIGALIVLLLVLWVGIRMGRRTTE